PVAPNARTARMLLASATFPLTPTMTRDRKRKAVLTKVAAGRACRATLWGSVTSISELACTTRLFRCPRHVFEILSRRRHHGRRDRALDKRRVDEPDVAVAAAPSKKVADCEDRAAHVCELADRLGLARPTVHGLLQTLQSHGFVEQDAYSEKYQLGPGLLQLGYSYLDLNELRARSISHADHLATRTGAAVRVGVMHGASVVVVHHVFRPAAAFGVLEVGLQLPLHASALGKAVLAFSPPQVLEDVLAEPLPRLTKQTLNEAELQRELKVIRHSGVAT